LRIVIFVSIDFYSFGVTNMLTRYRSSAQSYFGSQCSLLEGSALFARHHVSTTFPFPLPATASGLIARRRYEPTIFAPLPVTLPPLRLPHSTATCLQPAPIINDFRQLKVLSSSRWRQPAGICFRSHVFVTLYNVDTVFIYNHVSRVGSGRVGSQNSLSWVGRVGSGSVS